MKLFAGTCAPNAGPECWEIFSGARREQQAQDRLNQILGLDIVCFLAATALIIIYILLEKSKRK